MTGDAARPLTAVVLVGTLSPSPARSSSHLRGQQVLDAMAPHGVTGVVVRLVDHDIRPGVEVDMGDGDAWPAIRARIVGNEDGAHHTSAEIFQALDDVGFTLAAGAVTYWVGRAMETVDYQDLDETPETVASTTATLAANTVHLARLLVSAPYPPT